MSFNSNTWYSIQNYGNDFFLGCQNVGNCVANTNGTQNPELFQIATINGQQPYYIRPRALNTNTNGEPYCVNINTGVPAITTCNNNSAIWGIGDWSAGAGTFFFSTLRGNAQRLFLSNNQSYSLLDFSGVTDTVLANMQWGVSSRAAINDQSYSTIPAGITGSGSTTATSSAKSTSASTSTPSGSSSTSRSTGSTSSSSSAITPPATTVMVVTPTVTASPSTGASGSQSGSSISTPTLASSGADRPYSGLKTTMVLVLVLSQVVMICS